MGGLGHRPREGAREHPPPAPPRGPAQVPGMRRSGVGLGQSPALPVTCFLLGPWGVHGIALQEGHKGGQRTLPWSAQCPCFVMPLVLVCRALWASWSRSPSPRLPGPGPGREVRAPSSFQNEAAVSAGSPGLDEIRIGETFSPPWSLPQPLAQRVGGGGPTLTPRPAGTAPWRAGTGLGPGRRAALRRPRPPRDHWTRGLFRLRASRPEDPGESVPAPAGCGFGCVCTSSGGVGAASNSPAVLAPEVSGLRRQPPVSPPRATANTPRPLHAAHGALGCGGDALSGTPSSPAPSPSPSPTVVFSGGLWQQPAPEGSRKSRRSGPPQRRSRTPRTGAPAPRGSRRLVSGTGGGLGRAPLQELAGPGGGQGARALPRAPRVLGLSGAGPGGAPNR